MDFTTDNRDNMNYLTIGKADLDYKHNNIRFIVFVHFYLFNIILFFMFFFLYCTMLYKYVAYGCSYIFFLSKKFINKYMLFIYFLVSSL